MIGMITGWLFGSRIGLYGVAAVLVAGLVLAIALRVFNIGKNAAMTEVVNAQLQSALKKIAILKKQRHIAANMPGPAELDRILSGGEF
jgi:NhaP-type Na+/H+ or K+/H+ antiporter